MFNKQPGGKYGLKSKCRDCVREALYDWRNRHPDRFRKVGWAYELRKLYGITVEDYEEMLDAQGGVCAICGGNNEGHLRKNLKLAVDHNHETGRVRGLLCDKCNRGIGLLKNQENIESAMLYLRRTDI